ncbi:MAG: hypothetical protein OEM82_06765 [Acidobacteriota bacterium]|nr:hypothetical protein [Acidobacteriota bacterium]MDH3528816.1 hypothetical protein [Acidobacteriota bacterium]
MSLTVEIKEELGPLWIPSIYESRVRTRKTRSFAIDLPQKENKIDIVHTLLGIQLKARGKLIACPDLATARYLRVFARFGCGNVAVPYDITKISHIADELESAWHTSLLILERETAGESAQLKGRRRGSLLKAMRTEIEDLGAGTLMPEFDTRTKQRGS